MKKENVSVRVTLRWGQRWNPAGCHYETTPGKGLWVEVMPWGVAGSRMFRGCPLGSARTQKAALMDFVTRADPEYLGERPLTVDHLEIVQVQDRREPA